jgi:RNA polymerase sigma factor (sigma-70 family)
MKESPVRTDALLEPLLIATNDDQADEILLRLITIHADPVIKGVIRYKFRLSASHSSERDEADDLYQEVIRQLLEELRQFRLQPVAHPITDLRGMSAIIAHRTCSRWLRRQFPERHALKNRLHYLLTRQRGLALWQDTQGKQLGGFSEWQSKGLSTQVIARELPAELRVTRDGKPDLAATVATIFNHLHGPVEFDELVSTLASLLGVRDQPIESLEDDENTRLPVVADAGRDQAWQIEKRSFLQRLWEELQQLPLNQRIALLLNLKDSDGGGCITLFPATGIASLRQLAGVLEMEADAFANLWNELPLEDTRIAELLGVTRQQVINARKSGRERLARRLKGFF